MTAHAMKGDREKCLEAGMDGYIAKPIRRQEMLDAIEDQLGQATEETSAPGARAAEVLDKAEAMDRVAGDRELLRELVAIFLESCPKLLTDVREAIARGDPHAMERAGHTLKGAVGALGGRSAAGAAQRIEQIGKANDLRLASAAYADLEGEIERLKPALSELAAEAEN
jgi:HPt (histidine-containing phosphotransfer) domain-containing protein